MRKKAYREIIKNKASKIVFAMSEGNPLRFLELNKRAIKFITGTQSGAMKIMMQGNQLGTLFVPAPFIKFVNDIHQSNPEVVKWPVEQMDEYLMNDIIIIDPKFSAAVDQLQRNMEKVLEVDFEKGEKVHFQDFSIANINLQVNTKEARIPIIIAYQAFLKSQAAQKQMGVVPQLAPKGSSYHRKARIAKLNKIVKKKKK